jgi:hypothetical protein
VGVFFDSRKVFRDSRFLDVFHDADHTAPENLGLIVAVARKFNEVTAFH